MSQFRILHKSVLFAVLLFGYLLLSGSPAVAQKIVLLPMTDLSQGGGRG